MKFGDLGIVDSYAFKAAVAQPSSGTGRILLDSFGQSLALALPEDRSRKIDDTFLHDRVIHRISQLLPPKLRNVSSVKRVIFERWEEFIECNEKNEIKK